MQDDYTIHCLRELFVSRTPAGFLNDIQDLLTSQLIILSRRKLLDFPDLQQVFDQRRRAR